ncbi:50S ribosomal protein L21 [Candidatus Peregrinibacteria bacterium]|nr:50S ribosomal protein L21 [Candidatus Peregrinibacteria bacterium]
MFAITEIGGKQYRVQEKDVLNVEKLNVADNSKVSIDKVLLITDKETKIGTPYISGASVELKVLKTAKGDKVRTFKMKSKKRYKRTKNWRQPYSEVEVLSVQC